ncbi:MAG: SPOR domain-containing protein, partial [Cyclobacteriaceae bacterium]|nr:SPOR domain-containing protein [Cyclobacteriaceae bacterium]
QEPQPIDVTENQESLEDDTNISDNSQEKENREEQDDLETSSIPTIEDLDEGRTDDENSATETEEEAQEPQPIDVKEDQEPLEDDTNISDNSQEKENREEQDDLETSSIPTKVDLDEGQTDDENSATETSEEELNTQQDKAFSHSPIISEEDEDVQQYYERKEEFYGHDDTRSPLKTAMWIVIPIILMVSAGFYYFTYYNSGKIQDKDELQQSKLSHSLSTETPVEIVAPEAQARDDKKNENEINSRPKNADTSGSGQQTKPDDSSSAIGQNKIYSLILGSFKVEDNADKLLQQLRMQGMEVEKFQRGNRVH